MFDRFCNTMHQKTSAKKNVRMGSVKHKDVCGLLKIWRGVEKGIVEFEDCREVVSM